MYLSEFASAPDYAGMRRNSLILPSFCKIVDENFAQPQFANNLIAIAKYVQWVIRADGPMIWQTPTPMECTVKSSSPDYIVHLSLYEPTKPPSNNFI